MTVPVFALLRLLSDGRFHSEDKIGHELDLSPAKLSEALGWLASNGLDLQRDERSRCKLLTPFCAIDQAQIKHYLGERSRLFLLEVVDETGSTNDDLMVRAKQGASTGLVRVAEMQTAGRGRRERKWVGAPGGSLTFSLLWHFKAHAGSLAGLPLVVGVSLVRSLKAFRLQDIELKWPNDVLWRRRKIGGVLVESIANSGNGVWAVIGIGLNLRLGTPIAELIDQPVADLEAAGLRINRNKLLACVLRDLVDVLDTFSREGFPALRSEWERSHACQDKMATILTNDGECQTGRVAGVDNDGALLLNRDGSTHTIYSGEVSLRPKTD